MQKQMKQQHKTSTAAAITLLLCFCSFGVVCIVFASVGLCTGNRILGANAFWGATPLFSTGVAGQALGGSQRAVLILVGIFGGAGLTAFLLFLLIFPVVNRLFKTHLPCVGMFNRQYADDEDGDVQTEEPQSGEDANSDEKIKKDEAWVKERGGKADKADKADRADKAGAEAQRTKEKHGGVAVEPKRVPEKERESVAAPVSSGYEYDRYVKTVRIDTLYNPKQETTISSTKIDQAMRTSANPPSAKSAIEKPTAKPIKLEKAEFEKGAAGLGAKPQASYANVKPKQPQQSENGNKPDLAKKAKQAPRTVAAKPTLVKSDAAEQAPRTPDKQAGQKGYAKKRGNKKTPIAGILTQNEGLEKQAETERTDAERLGYIEKKVQESITNESKQTAARKNK